MTTNAVAEVGTKVIALTQFSMIFANADTKALVLAKRILEKTRASQTFD